MILDNSIMDARAAFEAARAKGLRDNEPIYSEVKRLIAEAIEQGDFSVEYNYGDKDPAYLASYLCQLEYNVDYPKKNTMRIRWDKYLWCGCL
jgi:hypothetical protein